MEYPCPGGDQMRAGVSHWRYAFQRLPSCWKLVGHQGQNGCRLLLQSKTSFFYAIFLFSYLFFCLFYFSSLVVLWAKVVFYFQILVFQAYFHSRIALFLIVCFRNSINFQLLLGFLGGVAPRQVFQIILQTKPRLMMTLEIIVNYHLNSLNKLNFDCFRANLKKNRFFKLVDQHLFFLK